MNSERDHSEHDRRSQQLVSWVNEGYNNALRLYGATHPLTRSWLKEKNEIEWFTAHEQRGAHKSAA